MSGIIEDATEKKRWLGHMVNFRSQWGFSSIEWMEFFTFSLIKMPVAWSLSTEFGLQPEWSELYRERYGEWGHTGEDHNALGTAYAWYIQNDPRFGDITLGDSPDFKTSMDGKVIVGDIGTCTPLAMHNGIDGLYQMHGLWISVLSYDIQVVLEFNYNPAEYRAFNMESRLYPESFDREQALRAVFWCDDCKMWTVTEETRDQFWKHTGTTKPVFNKQ